MVKAGSWRLSRSSCNKSISLEKQLVVLVWANLVELGLEHSQCPSCLIVTFLEVSEGCSVGAQQKYNKYSVPCLSTKTRGYNNLVTGTQIMSPCKRKTLERGRL